MTSDDSNRVFGKCGCSVPLPTSPMIQCTNIRPPDLAIDGETIREMFKVNGYGIDMATFRKACAKLNWTMAWNKVTDIVEVWTIGITGQDRILKQILRSILCP